MSIASINPATGEVVKTFQALSDAEIEKKLQLAVSAFKAERKTPFAVRAKRMLKAAEILERDKDKFAHLMTLEMGKPYKAAVAEAVKCTTACRYYAENTERFLADEVVETGAKKSFVRYLPIGPVLAVMPWNFPFWQVIRFAAPALMAGNVGLLKHASNVPQCALAIEEIFLEAGFPEGVFQTLLIGSAAGGCAVERSAGGGGDADRQRAGRDSGGHGSGEADQESCAGVGRERSVYRDAQRRSGCGGEDCGGGAQSSTTGSPALPPSALSWPSRLRRSLSASLCERMESLRSAIRLTRRRSLVRWLRRMR